ncbi:hypothetical protein EJF36_15740 [Bacillus sp. HMF5848]|uniref:YtzH-like family protein n=1 Tax=Bacillus sp. HMF5848 TaxID=2495421 RepID=UPI000F7A1E14|nr:YtzH-like family protein [Bacillus sp. HMF5848]RSK28220.1 hypothetical protein EJF36_15740 [Bacillus sp. HMF5848]
MPLNSQHQISVLRDILSEHELDCCGTVAECEQLERLIKSLMVNTSLDSNLKHVLEDIYSYSQTGQYSQHLDEHIQGHQQNIGSWISQIDQFS